MNEFEVELKELTFTVLAMTSENGGTMPDTTVAIEKPNRRQVANTIVLFAPAPQAYNMILVRKIIQLCFISETRIYIYTQENPKLKECTIIMKEHYTS